LLAGFDMLCPATVASIWAFNNATFGARINQRVNGELGRQEVGAWVKHRLIRHIPAQSLRRSLCAGRGETEQSRPQTPENAIRNEVFSHHARSAHMQFEICASENCHQLF